jgi:hypothetical protein
MLISLPPQLPMNQYGPPLLANQNEVIFAVKSLAGARDGSHLGLKPGRENINTREKL